MLEAHEVSVRFGGVQALDGVTLHARAGEVSGLIGPNGAGKSTLFDVLTGLRRPRSGTVRFAGRDVTGWSPARRSRAGLGRTFQRLELFSHLSVRDNVAVAAEFRLRWPRGRARIAGIVSSCIERVGLDADADRMVGELSTGRARLVELARALAVEPRALLLDEPASGLDDAETPRFGALLRDLAQRDGLAIVLVEHDVGLVMDVCDVLTVLDLGTVLASGTPGAVRSDPAVRAAYLGTTPAGGR